MLAKMMECASEACGGVGIALIVCTCVVFSSRTARSEHNAPYCYSCITGCCGYDCDACPPPGFHCDPCLD